MVSHRSLFVGTISATVGAVILFPSAANSAGPDTTCGNPATNWEQEFCISKYPNSNHSTDNYMTQGWTASVFSGIGASYYLGNHSFSNGGGVVASNVNSARNKDNVRQERMCFYDDFGSYAGAYVTYSWSGWKNTSGSAKYIKNLTMRPTHVGC